MESIVSAKLQSLCPVRIHLAWHENRSSYLTYRKEKGALHLRLHRLFLTAPSPVLEALILYTLKGDKAAGQLIGQMAHLHFSEIKVPPAPLNPKGQIYDLISIYESTKKLYFPPDFSLSIGWSNTSRARKFRSITFGTYDWHRNQIRINSLLDDPAIPLYFLEFLVYHEMLHAICPRVTSPSGRTLCHTPEFRSLEKKHHHYLAAKEWEKQSLQFFKKRKSHGRS
jgi:hypothetical protein